MIGRRILGGLFLSAILFQIYCDVRAFGASALLGPVELVTATVCIGMFSINRLKGSMLGRSWRRFTNTAMQYVLSLSAILACFVLGALLFYVAAKGIHGLSFHLFTELPRPPGIEGGGMRNAIIGTLLLVLIASIGGIPVGLLAGIYVSCFSKGKLGDAVRFSADVLNGIPSVVIGLFAYAAFVLPFKHFSAWSGGLALSIMMVPTILRTTEEMIKMVPASHLEGALALGARRGYAVRTVVVPAAKNGIVTGVMLAIARVSGETAPLLFTAFGSGQLVLNPSQPVSSLTMQIYQYAISPYDDWVAQAWSGALVLLMMILSLNVAARVLTRRMSPAR
ncbi:MAG: phosphate ABC transporter permease PstA [Armatimonadetes bacterium]|nr:phosphate ABC transporter permease PstA [Armatimonadota bacterium]